jgi:hypothetical protein
MKLLDQIYSEKGGTFQAATFWLVGGVSDADVQLLR